MERRIYTVQGNGSRDFEAITDKFDPFALALPPLWLLWHGLWFSLGAMILICVAAFLAFPASLPPVLYGLAALLGFEGGSVRRTELSLRGWRIVATVEAGSEAGAEEVYLTGRVS